MNVRRIVSSLDSNGKPVFLSDGPAPRAHRAKHWEGNAAALVWTTEPGTTRAAGAIDRTPDASWHPAPGGTAIMIVELPPDAVFGTPTFDGMAMGKEQAQLVPGLGERFSPDGMHATDTVDYAVVLEGQIALELEGGETKTLEKGDVVVQTGARHAWRNGADRPARMLFVLVGAG